MGSFCDLTGMKFGRLTVIKRFERGKPGRPKWVCQCECGGESISPSSSLKAGRTQSCGCLQRERTSAAAKIYSVKHGMNKTPEHYSWRGMLTRCLNPNATGYERYGAIGVQVCERWKKFENFYADMGPRPSLAHTLDRYPDRFGNYEPGNCRWATPEEQQSNRRDVVNGRRVHGWRELRAIF